MKKLIVMMFALALPTNAMATDESFNVSLKLLKPIAITETHALLFPDTTIIDGVAQDITVLPASGDAAAFNATGGKNRIITRSVVESSINMSASGVVGTIAVDTFVVTGPTAFDGSGDITGIKVGATAHILAGSEDGDYSGTATLRVLYQ